MTTITRDKFTEPRTPEQLADYVKTTYERIASDSDLRKKARLHIEPYKTFLEELLPFSHFCTWEYGNRTDVQCALLPATSRCGTPGHDAQVIDKGTGAIHAVELTWPVDGKHMREQATEMNDEGRTTIEEWDYNDTSKQEAAVNRTIEIGRKKCLRDYRAPGGSSIIFVFDKWLFWDDNPRHARLLTTLETELSAMPLRADHILLMLIHGDRVKIKCVEPLPSHLR